MTETDPPAPAGHAAQREDWLTIWQSELAACALDRELHEAAQRVVDLAATQIRAALTPLAALLDQAGPSGPPAPPRAPPPDDASAERIRTLEARVAELERLLRP